MGEHPLVQPREVLTSPPRPVRMGQSSGICNYVETLDPIDILIDCYILKEFMKLYVTIDKISLD